MDTLQNFISRLEKVRRTGDNQYIACCPHHGESNPSLSVTHKNGRVLMHCFSHGCSPLNIVHSVGLQLSDLFDDNRQDFIPSTVSRKERAKADTQQHLVMRAIMRITITNQWVDDGKVLTAEDKKKYSAAFHYLEDRDMLGELNTVFGEIMVERNNAIA